MDTKARILITGANGGMGIRICHKLLKLGFRHLILGTRSESSAKSLLKELSSVYPQAAGTLITLAGFDMNAPDKIQAAVDSLRGTQPVDVLFLQAGGVVYGKRRQSVEFNGMSIEATVFQNVFGGHYTFKALGAAGLLAEGARIIVAGGEGARGIPGMIAKPEFASAQEFGGYLQAQNADQPYVEMDAMGVSKFVGAVWARKMFETYHGRYTTLWFTPGFTAGTQGLDGVGALKQFILENFGFPMLKFFGVAQSAEQGAEKFTQAVVGELGESGDVLGAPEGKTLGKIQDQIPMNPQMDDPALKEELWRVLQRVFGPAPERATAS